ncbi:MAG: ribosome small subunit-dependent GTPase A [Bacteriovorax sp.]|nr:ribosome small subunit-dependent GTPase A [Bacteriovorax sp.]
MINSNAEFLSHFGWNGFFESQVLTMSSKNLVVARVVNEEKNLYRLQFDFDKSVWSAVTGKMQFEAVRRSDFPAVGDWVLAEIPPGSERAVVRFIFNRQSSLQRKKVGEVSEVQILATNVDYVFITTSINSDLNYGRLDRYLTFAWDSGSTPVILLTKADLSADVEVIISQVKERFHGVNIHALSKDNFESVEFLKDYMKPGKTSVLVGSSGVGKSTIANFLIGEEIIKTLEVRESDDKGRHTTTSRALYESIYGGLIIDTPGMRELQFADHEAGLAEQFGDIEELISKCHFSNCQHEAEKGCAVIPSLENGELLPERWKNFNKIAKEVRHAMRKQHKWILAQDRKIWKKRSIESRQKYKGWQ